MVQRGVAGRRATLAELHVLVRPADARDLAAAAARAVADLGGDAVEASIEDVSQGCEPENMLLAEYRQRLDSPPVSECLHRLTVAAEVPDGVDDREVTAAAAGVLPPLADGGGGPWYGHTRSASPAG